MNKVVQNIRKNDDFNVGDKVRYAYSVRGADVDEVFQVVKDIDFQYVMIRRMSDGREWKEFSHNLVLVNNTHVTNPVVQNAIAWKNALNISSKQKSMQLVSARSEPVVQYTKVLPGKLYFRRLGRIYMCDDNDLNRRALEVQGFRILPYQVGGVVGNGTLATNAIQFGIGNKVMHRDSKMHGTIVGKYNAYLWNVKWDAGFTEPASPDDLVFISMHSKCAANAKYSVGTKVKSPSGKIGHITSVTPGSDYAMVHLDVEPYGEDEWDISKCTVVNFTFKVGDRVKADRPYGLRGKVGTIKSIDLAGDLMVDYDNGGVMRVPSAYAIGVNGIA